MRKDVERTRANVASGMAAQGSLISRLLARDGTPLARFLDIGCGSGFFSWYAHSVRPDLQLTLLDYSVPGILRAALTMRKAGIDADLVQGNAFKLPFKADQFDASCTSGLLEHFDRGQQDTILREQARVGTHNYCQAPVDTLGYWMLRRWVTWRLGKWPFGFEVPLKKAFFVELLQANGWQPKARSAQSLFTAFALHILKLRSRPLYRLLSPLERVLDYDVCWLCERR